jgi:hypothetical protein
MKAPPAIGVPLKLEAIELEVAIAGTQQTAARPA